MSRERWVLASWTFTVVDKTVDTTIRLVRLSPPAREFKAILKGPEIALGDSLWYLDTQGHRREDARARWWDGSATTLSALAEIPPGCTTPNGEPFPNLPNDPIPPGLVPRYTGYVPVIFGHYWRSGSLSVNTTKTVCVDFSAVKAGPMVAYRWSGETDLTDAHLVAVYSS